MHFMILGIKGFSLEKCDRDAVRNTGVRKEIFFGNLFGNDFFWLPILCCSVGNGICNVSAFVTIWPVDQARLFAIFFRAIKTVSEI